MSILSKIMICILVFAAINFGGYVRLYLLSEIRGRLFFWTMIISNFILLVGSILFVLGVIGDN